jgi:hypothetical protein
MDCRCPRGLRRVPKVFCPLAVARLRWMEGLGREPTEDEEEVAPGCPWSIRNHSASFCFFKFMENIEEPLTESQISHQLCLSEHSIKKSKDIALCKLAKTEVFAEIRETHDNCPLVDDRLVDPYEADYQDMSTKYETPVSELVSDSTGGEVIDFSEMKQKRAEKRHTR